MAKRACEPLVSASIFRNACGFSDNAGPFGGWTFTGLVRRCADGDRRHVIGRYFFRLAFVSNGPAPRGGNGINEVFFEASMAPGPFYAGVDIQRDGRYRRVQSDVQLNPRYAWFYYQGPLRHEADGTRIPDLYRVTLHEMGHLLGFTHSHSESANSAMRSHMSDVDDPTPQDIRDAREAVAYLFQKNAPKVISPEKFRSVSSRRGVRLRGSARPFFTPNLTLRIQSGGTWSTRRFHVSGNWKRWQPLAAGVNRIRFFYRRPAGSLVLFAKRRVR